MEGEEGVGFTNATDFVFDMGRESFVELTSESSFTPFSSGGKSVELNNVFSNSLVVLHLEVFYAGFGISYWVVGSEVLF